MSRCILVEESPVRQVIEKCRQSHDLFMCVFFVSTAGVPMQPFGRSCNTFLVLNSHSLISIEFDSKTLETIQNLKNTSYNLMKLFIISYNLDNNY